MYKSLVFGDEFLAQGPYTPYTQRHCHVRIEKGPFQTVAIKLEADSLEYHYMLKH